MSRFSLNYLGIFFIIISFLSFFNIIYSYYFNLYLNIETYIFTLFISLIIGSILLFKKKIDKKITIYEKIFIVIIGYILLPIIISIPYYLSIYNISLIDCYFEAISGFTSTGFTIIENIKHFDESLILWRSSSQWIEKHRSDHYFHKAKEMGYKVGKELLKKAGSDFITQGN